MLKKLAVLFLSLLFVSPLFFGAVSRAADVKNPLDGIDDRIEKLRKGDGLLRLLGPDGKPVAKGAEIVIEQTRHQFLFGSNIFKFEKCRTPQQNEEYKKRFAELFNFATIGFYWGSYERAPDVLPSEESNIKAARWCAENNIRTKGHPLVWTIEPRWPGEKPIEEGEALLWKRVDREIKRFDGLIDVWDVLNEPVVGINQARERNARVLLCLYERDGVQEVIRKAFAQSRRANPDATLILNDYITDAKFEKFVRDSLESGVSIDVVGIQSHMHGRYWGARRVWDVCERFAQFDKPIHFTETTLVSGPKKKEGAWLTTPEGETQQARDAVEFYSLLFSHPAVEAVTWWDFSDQGAWQQAPAGFLREDMSPKPIYVELKKLIKDKWWTGRVETTNSGDGSARFRGFLGDYRVSVDTGAGTLTGAFSLKERGVNAIDVHLK